jgi:glucose-6-phosphate 1-dehydrogenase
MEMTPNGIPFYTLGGKSLPPNKTVIKYRNKKENRTLAKKH